MTFLFFSHKNPPFFCRETFILEKNVYGIEMFVVGLVTFSQVFCFDFCARSLGPGKPEWWSFGLLKIHSLEV